MAIVGGSLADGQLPATKGTLYTSTGITYEKIIALGNGGGTSESINIFFNRSGTSRLIRSIALDPGQCYELSIALPMSPGDTLEGQTTNAATVDYVIGGGTG